MLATVIQYGNTLDLRDRSGQSIANIGLGNGQLVGYSSSLIVIQYGNSIVTYDGYGNKLGGSTIPNNHKIVGVFENGFNARVGNVMVVYDEYVNPQNTFSI